MEDLSSRIFHWMISVLSKTNYLAMETIRRKNATMSPTPYFIDPVLSHVGLNEKMAKEKGIAYKVVTLPAAAIPRARVVKQTDGLLKALVDPRHKRDFRLYAILC